MTLEGSLRGKPVRERIKQDKRDKRTAHDCNLSGSRFCLGPGNGREPWSINHMAAVPLEARVS